MKQEHAQISRRVRTVGIFTLLSRILGLVRDSVMAWAFGATRIADAFYVAFRIPNLLRRLVAEGALTIAFVPVFTENLRKSREDGKQAANVIFTYLSLFLVVLVVAGIVFAPVIVKLVAWGFQSSADKFDLTVLLTRLMFPYILLISLVALAMGILNSLKHFAAPAASPILLNLGIIAGAAFLWRFFEMPAIGLAVGVLIGGVSQLLLQIPPLVKEGMLPKFDFNFRHPALRSMLFLMIPSAFGAAVYQINVLVVTLFASFLPEGSVSYLWYADRVSEFSLGIYSIAVATVTLPTLSEHAAKKDLVALKDTLNFGLRLSFLIDIPAACGLLLLSKPIVSVLFERGEFGERTTIATAAALMIFALKLPFVAGVRNLVPGFFALKDARTPVFVSAVAVVVNAICAWFLMKPYLHVGLAMALVVSSVVNVSLLVYFFRRKVGLIGGRLIIRSVSKTCLATAVMAASILTMMHFMKQMLADGILAKGSALSIIIFAAVVIYLVAVRFINKEEFKALTEMVKRKRKKVPIPNGSQETS